MTRLYLFRTVFAVCSLGLAGLLPARLTAQHGPGQLWTQDDEWAAVAKRVPGFAGFWQEGSTLVLALVDTTQRAAALRDIAGQFPGYMPGSSLCCNTLVGQARPSR